MQFGRYFLMSIMLCLISIVSIDVSASENQNFVTMADIHFSPFVNCRITRPCAVVTKLRQAPASQWGSILNAEHAPLSVYHEDTNYPLLKSAIAAASKTAVDKHAQFVIVLGDTLAHSYRRLYKFYTGDNSLSGYQTFVYKTYQFINGEMSHAFPAIDVYMVVGNNDSYRGDYTTQVGGAFFQDEGRLWSTLIKNTSNRVAMQKDFSHAGYYAVNLPDKTRLIVLNSNLFSSKARGKDVDKGAIEQFTWLHNQLVDVKKSGQTAWIAMHIPESVDVYSTLITKGFSLVEFWRVEYIDLFQKELKEFAPEIMAIFSGHLHSDWLQVIKINKSNDIPVTGTPSVSPIHGNNPGYKLYTYSTPNSKLVDYVTYYLSLGGAKEWSMEYQFNHIYQQNCRNCPITAGIRLIHKDGYLSDYYKLFYAVSTNSQPITTKWDPYYWCAIWHVQPDDYKKCLS